MSPKQVLSKIKTTILVNKVFPVVFISFTIWILSEFYFGGLFTGIHIIDLIGTFLFLLLIPFFGLLYLCHFTSKAEMHALSVILIFSSAFCGGAFSSIIFYFPIYNPDGIYISLCLGFGGSGLALISGLILKENLYNDMYSRREGIILLIGNIIIHITLIFSLGITNWIVIFFSVIFLLGSSLGIMMYGLTVAMDKNRASWTHWAFKIYSGVIIVPTELVLEMLR